MMVLRLADIKRISESVNEKKVLVPHDEYKEIIQDLFAQEQLLQERYGNAANVPRVYKIYGVSIEIRSDKP
jgi:hypothetical protein